MRDIDEIWIVEPRGITIFNISKEDNIDPVLIGGFFASLQTFIHEIGEKELNALALGESQIVLYKGTDEFLFIARSQKNIKQKTIQNHLKTVEKRFFKRYGSILKNWDGESGQFRIFEGDVEDIFKDTPERRAAESLW